MLSLPKNQKSPESAVYLIGAGRADVSFVLHVIFVAKRLLLRQIVFGELQPFVVTVRVTLLVTCVVPLPAVSVYVVVAEGATVVEPLTPTPPMPRSIDAEVAFDVDQDSEDVPPAFTVDGEAVNELIVGAVALQAPLIDVRLL